MNFEKCVVVCQSVRQCVSAFYSLNSLCDLEQLLFMNFEKCLVVCGSVWKFVIVCVGILTI